MSSKYLQAMKFIIFVHQFGRKIDSSTIFNLRIEGLPTDLSKKIQKVREKLLWKSNYNFIFLQ